MYFFAENCQLQWSYSALIYIFAVTFELLDLESVKERLYSSFFVLVLIQLLHNKRGFFGMWRNLS